MRDAAVCAERIRPQVCPGQVADKSRASRVRSRGDPRAIPRHAGGNGAPSSSSRGRAIPGPARLVTRQIGDVAEDLVARRLVAAGWQIIGRNVRVGHGELDIVAIDPRPPSALVVVEVRWRHDRGFGLPEETFDHRKRAHLRRAIDRLCAVGALPDGAPLPALPLRVDLVAVEPPLRPGDPPRVRHHRSVLAG